MESTKNNVLCVIPRPCRTDTTSPMDIFTAAADSINANRMQGKIFFFFPRFPVCIPQKLTMEKFWGESGYCNKCNIYIENTLSHYLRHHDSWCYDCKKKIHPTYWITHLKKNSHLSNEQLQCRATLRQFQVFYNPVVESAQLSFENSIFPSFPSEDDNFPSFPSAFPSFPSNFPSENFPLTIPPTNNAFPFVPVDPPYSFPLPSEVDTFPYFPSCPNHYPSLPFQPTGPLPSDDNLFTVSLLRNTEDTTTTPHTLIPLIPTSAIPRQINLESLPAPSIADHSIFNTETLIINQENDYELRPLPYLPSILNQVNLTNDQLHTNEPQTTLHSNQTLSPLQAAIIDPANVQPDNQPLSPPQPDGNDQLPDNSPGTLEYIHLIDADDDTSYATLLPNHTPPNSPPAEINTPEEIKLLKWFLKNFISRESADDLISILKSDFDLTKLIKPNFKSIKNEWKKTFMMKKVNLILKVPIKKTKFGADSDQEEEEQQPPRRRRRQNPEDIHTIDVKFTVFSVSHILVSFLQTPLGQTSIIKSSSGYSQDPYLQSYHHPCSGEWFQHFEQQCQSEYKLPLALVLFFDPFEAIHSISRGALMIGVLNVKSKVLLSPYTKFPIALVPNNVELDGIIAYFIQQILYLEKDGISIINSSGEEENYMVRIAYAAGDSKDLNGFVGLKGPASLFGCRLCWISHDNYTDAPATAGIKSSSQIMKIHSTIFPSLSTHGLIGKAKKLFHNFSIHAKGLSEMFLIDADFMLQSPADLLHNEELGLLADEILHIFEDHIPKQKIPDVFAYFTKIPVPKCSVSLVGRLEHMKSFRGNDWKTLAFQLPIVLSHLNIGIGSDWYKCFILHLQYYRLLCQKLVSKENLADFQKYFVQHHNLYKDLYPGDFSHLRNNERFSSNKINFHLTNHWPIYIQLFGAPLFFSLEVFEHAIKLLKKAHKNTNGKNPTENVPENALQLSLGVVCDQTYEQFSKKELINKLKWPKTKVKDPKLHLGEQLFHWNTVKINSTQYHLHDTILLQDGQFGVIQGIWADNIGDFSSTKIKMLCYYLIGQYKPTPIWDEILLTEKSILITPAQIQSKIYTWSINTVSVCDTLFHL
jgi:hypothetical protein